MIEDAPIVQDTRRVRALISRRFDDDIDRYLDYLSNKNQETPSKVVVKKKVRTHRKKISPKYATHATM